MRVAYHVIKFWQQRSRMYFFVVDLIEVIPWNHFSAFRIFADDHLPGSFRKPCNVFLSISERWWDIVIQRIWGPTGTFHSQEKAPLSRRWHCMPQFERWAIKALQSMQNLRKLDRRFAPNNRLPGLRLRIRRSDCVSSPIHTMNQHQPEILWGQPTKFIRSISHQPLRETAGHKFCWLIARCICSTKYLLWRGADRCWTIRCNRRSACQWASWWDFVGGV